MKLLRLLTTVLCLYSCSLFSAEPPNLSLVRQEAIAYYNHGDYFNTIQKTLTSAKQYLQKRINEEGANTTKKRLAVVLDIDETALSNYQFLQRNDFKDTDNLFEKMILEKNAKQLAATYQLYQFALKNNVAVFFVTGRKLHLANATISNLKKAGYNQWTHLYLKPDTYAIRSNIPYKKEARKEITQQGYTIVTNIGDQNSDLAGGYAEKAFKLPNPYYFVP